MDRRGIFIIIVIVIVAIAFMGLTFANTGSFMGYKKAYETNALVCSDPDFCMGDGARFVIYDQGHMQYRRVMTQRLLWKGDTVKISVNRFGWTTLIDK